MIKAPRGTRDLFPPDTALWNFVEATVREVFRLYNFHEIRTPIFEETQLFARGVGEETDIVSKEMYTWEDRGRAESDRGQSLTLRPENTAGVVRASKDSMCGVMLFRNRLLPFFPEPRDWLNNVFESKGCME